MERVIFFSIDDMSAGFYLEKAEKILDTIDINVDFSLIDCIEFDNIYKFFKNDIFLNKWDEEKKERYKTMSQDLLNKSIVCFSGIDGDYIFNHIDELDNLYEYQRCFWQIIDKFKAYEKISSDFFTKILNKKPRHINFILESKNLVKKFESEVRNFLLTYDKSGELLLNHIKAKNDSEKRIFPQSLTNDDKEGIIDRYVDNSSERFDDLEFISRLGDDNFLRLSPKIKLKAKKLHSEKLKAFFAKSNTVKFGFQARISETQQKPIVRNETEDGMQSFSYSLSYLNSIDFELNPLEVFRTIFGYINKQGLIDLISKNSEIGAMEMLFSHRNKNDYYTSMWFKSRQMLSLLNLQLLSDYLRNIKNSYIENIINQYVTNILSKMNYLENIQFQLTNYDMSYQEKITNLIPKFDSFIKQFKCYAEEGKIDFELIDIDSKPTAYRAIPSLLTDKYFYEVDDKLARVKHYFYSDQSGLYYLEGFKKYNNFYDLINKENLNIEVFVDYQQKIINELIKDGYLHIDEGKYIKIKDVGFMYLVGELYREGVLSYYAYTEPVQKKIAEMRKNELVFAESTLLSKQESDYMNYYLNKSMFTNGPDIRNKNIHGHNYSSNDEAYNDYMVLLKITILILLKIDIEIKTNSKR